MWIGSTSISELDAANRWTVAFFAAETITHSSVHPMVAIREIVEERKAALDPRTLGDERIAYIGLENVRSLTGELVSFEPVLASSIKSRSKTYEEGDVLYGRLRPELNKVWLAETAASPGICSNEFIVLRANAAKVRSRYLRYVLASRHVSQFAAKLRTGASLPRMATADLLALMVPLPPLAVQDEICNLLSNLDKRLRDLRATLDWLPDAITDSFTRSLDTGPAELDATLRTLGELA